MAQANGLRFQRYAAWKIVFISSICGIVVSVGIIFVFFAYLRDTEFFNSTGCEVLSNFSVCYISKVGAWNDSSYLQTITGFYNSIITILIAAIAVVATLGAYTMRAGNKFQIEQDLPDGVSEFFEKERGKDLVEKVAYKEISEQLKSVGIPEQGQLRDLLTGLEKRIDELELQLQEMQE